MHNKVTCTDFDQFCEVLAQLTRKGVAFEANAGSLTVIITGY